MIEMNTVNKQTDKKFSPFWHYNKAITGTAIVCFQPRGKERMVELG